MIACNCHQMSERVIGRATPGKIRECPACGQHWIVVAWCTGPPPGHRGQWTGCTERRISARRARKLIKAGSAHMGTS